MRPEGQREGIPQMRKEHEDLVLANTGLAYKVAGKYHSSAYSFEDCLQECFLLMVEWTPRFNESMGMKYSTFIYERLCWGLQRVLDNKKWLIRQSAYLAASRRALLRTAKNLTMEKGRLAGISALSAHTGKSREMLEEIICKPAILPDTKAYAVGERARFAEDSLEDMFCFGRLQPTEKFVLRLFFEDGLDGPEVGQVLGVTRERARQLKERALEKCRGAYCA